MPEDEQVTRESTPGVAAKQSSSPSMAPFTPNRRLSFPNRLSLQMPARGPLSPVLDPALGYSVGRRPRLDFARACTSLHHSTLAESSPDSSPLAAGSFSIPRPPYNHNHNHARGLDSPIAPGIGSSHASSLGSQSMYDYAPSAASDSDSSTDEDCGLDDIDLDIPVTTPITSTTLGNGGFGNSSEKPTQSAAMASLVNHQMARRDGRPWRQRHGHSHSMSHPAPYRNPSPTLRASRAAAAAIAGDLIMRRDILDLGPAALVASGVPAVAGQAVAEPVRRPVSRRGSLLPKTKHFNRIKAALIEECSPLDVDKREAEIIKQIRDEDEGPVVQAPSSVISPPMVASHRASQDSEILSDVGPDDTTIDSDSQMSNSASKRKRLSFQMEAAKHGGFWFSDMMDGIVTNSPVPAFPSPGAMSVGSANGTTNSAAAPVRDRDGDAVMGGSGGGAGFAPPSRGGSGSGSDTLMPSPGGFGSSGYTGPMITPVRSGKRRRADFEELFESNVFKRRAVSPSLMGSPVLGSPPNGQQGKGGNGSGGHGPARLGWKGLTDAGEGIMKMTL